MIQCQKTWTSWGFFLSVKFHSFFKEYFNHTLGSFYMVGGKSKRKEECGR